MTSNRIAQKKVLFLFTQLQFSQASYDKSNILLKTYYIIRGKRKLIMKVHSMENKKGSKFIFKLILNKLLIKNCFLIGCDVVKT